MKKKKNALEEKGFFFFSSGFPLSFWIIFILIMWFCRGRKRGTTLLCTVLTDRSKLSRLATPCMSPKSARLVETPDLSAEAAVVFERKGRKRGDGVFFFVASASTRKSLGWEERKKEKPPRRERIGFTAAPPLVPRVVSSSRRTTRRNERKNLDTTHDVERERKRAGVHRHWRRGKGGGATTHKG